MPADSYHFVGIGGIGMSGLARILLQKKQLVSGSDVAQSAVTDSLKRAGAQLYTRHAAEHVTQKNIVVYSSDIPNDNPELKAAQKLQCPLLHRSELLTLLMEGYKPLAVTGTHGKTTTTALLIWVCLQAGLDPAYAVGGLLAQLNVNAAHGTGPYFVLEADESDSSFLSYSPYGAILTNIDLDHLSHYGSEQALIQAFHRFAMRVQASEQLFWCGDDQRLKALRLPGNSYGFDPSCALRATHFHQTGWHSVFDAVFEGCHYQNIEVALAGRHNISNALAVFGLALRLGIEEATIRQALRTFPGVHRRCEKKGEAHTVLVVDDYAHHPSEINVTLKAIREAIGSRRLIAVYQPHRFSRTKECIGHYGHCFAEADEILITDLYSAREEPIPGISYQVVLQEVEERTKVPCHYVPRHLLKGKLAADIRPHDVVVTLGAGDITKLSGELADLFQRQPPKKWVVGLICGGVSTEHKVTLLSAAEVIPCLNRNSYVIKQFGITKEGNWLWDPDIVSRLQQELSQSTISAEEPKLSPVVLHELLECDVLIPILHGTYGEDGIAQGFFEVLGKAYVGSDHRAAAISMDKAVCKKLCQCHGIRTAPFLDFSRTQWQLDPELLWQQIEQRFSFPLWAKPTHLGSSVEVHRVTSRETLCSALERIFRVDTHALVEAEVVGRELEIAVYGNDKPVAFPPGEVFTGERTYDYEGKYSSGGTPTAAIAELSIDLASEGAALAIQIYQIAHCSGLARIDFFLDGSGRYWFNEINPLPGLTKNSLYPRICEAHGFTMSTLFDQLIILALERHRRKSRLEV